MYSFYFVTTQKTPKTGAVSSGHMSLKRQAKLISRNKPNFKKESKLLKYKNKKQHYEKPKSNLRININGMFNLVLSLKSDL